MYASNSPYTIKFGVELFNRSKCIKRVILVQNKYHHHPIKKVTWPHYDKAKKLFNSNYSTISLIIDFVNM